MPGILDLYVTACHGHIEGHRKNQTMRKVSRAMVDFTILTQLDKAKFPMEYKAAWYHAVLNMDMFESLWKSMQVTHRLSDEQIERYVPDENLLAYELPKAGTIVAEGNITLGEETTNDDDEQLTFEVAERKKKNKRVLATKRGGKHVRFRLDKDGAVGKVKNLKRSLDR